MKIRRTVAQTEMQNKKIFIVVGMHRSGTSLVTHCLKNLGLQLSKSLIPISSDNPDGFFEDKKIVDINSRVEFALNRSHTDSTSILPLPKEWHSDTHIKGLTAELSEYIKFSVQKFDSFLIKDPRICRLLPMYLNVLALQHITPVFIYVHRSPNSIIRSKSRRDLLDPDFVEIQWQLSAMESLTSIYNSGFPICNLSYESLLRNNEQELSRIRKFLCTYSNDIVAHWKAPEIRADNFESNLNLDKNTIALNAFSEDLDSYLERQNGWSSPNTVEPPQFSKLRRQFKLIQQTASPWTKALDTNSTMINKTDQLKRSIKRSQTSLKVSNGKIFGLTTKLQQTASRLHDETTLRIKIQLNLDKSRKQYNTLLVEHEGLVTSHEGLVTSHEGLVTNYEQIQSEYKKLHLKSRTKIFRAANFLLHVKTKYIVNVLRSSRSRLSRTIYTSTVNAKKVRRSFLNDGLKTTFKKLVRIALSRNELSRTPLNNVRALRETSRLLILENNHHSLEAHEIELLLDIFLLESYVITAKLDAQCSYLNGLKHFLDFGIGNGLSPSPLFNIEHYRSSQATKDLGGNEAFLDWLRYGSKKNIIPTVLFDHDFFIARHALSSESAERSFQHFINKSVHNNAAPNQYFNPHWYVSNHDLGETKLAPFYHYLIVGSMLNYRPSPMFPAFPRSFYATEGMSPMESLMTKVNFSEYRRRISHSSLLLDLVGKASKIEPKITALDGARMLNILPYSNPFFPAIKELRLALKHSFYATIILIPHCRYGGSGLVAGELCRSIGRINPNENALLVRTDNDDFMRPDWFPPELEIVNLLDFASDLPDMHRKKVLLDLLIGLKPNYIINVHSRLAWEVFVQYGDRLRNISKLLAYTFCYDLSPLGSKVGYPIKYVPVAMEYLNALIVDNNYIKHDLVKNNDWNTAVSNKIKVVRTPYQENALAYIKRAEQNISINKKARPLVRRNTVFWAGRFDRQKRFDIVVKLAKLNPQLDFYVWGAAMLGDDKTETCYPRNILLQGLFKEYSEIPFETCDVWLFTSQWEGLPTILIELGLRKVPLVASRIWGTADLISEDTAWPVDAVTKVDEYNVGIHEVLQNKTATRARAENLYSFIKSQHSPSKYDSAVKTILNA